MSHRTNLVLSDKAWSMLQEIPKGRRSEVVSEALVSELTIRRRRDAATRLDALRGKMQPLAGSAEQWIREDRDSH